MSSSANANITLNIYTIQHIHLKPMILNSCLASENVEYEIDFIQEQRKVDDEDDRLDSRRRKRPDTVDDFGVVDSSKLITSSGGGGWEVQNKNQQKKKIGFEIRKQLQSEDVMTETEASRFQDVWSLDLKDRWRLYRKWVRDISQQHQNTIASIQGEYEEGMKEQQEWRNAQNYEHLKSAHVIGMTTTGTCINMADVPHLIYIFFSGWKLYNE